MAIEGLFKTTRKLNPFTGTYSNVISYAQREAGPRPSSNGMTGSSSLPRNTLRSRIGSLSGQTKTDPQRSWRVSREPWRLPVRHPSRATEGSLGLVSWETAVPCKDTTATTLPLSMG